MIDFIGRWRIATLTCFLFLACGTLHAVYFDNQGMNNHILNLLDIADHDIIIQTSSFTIPTANHSDVVIRFESNNRGKIILQQSTGELPGEIMEYRLSVMAQNSTSFGRDLLDVDLAIPKQLIIYNSELQHSEIRCEMSIKALKNSAVFRGKFSDTITLSIMDI